MQLFHLPVQHDLFHARGRFLIRTVDPEGRWPESGTDRFARFRPMNEAAEIQYRLGLLERAKPTTLLLGNSRTLHGFSIESFDSQTFNAAMEGAQMQQQEHYAHFALDKFKVRRLIIGADFGMFIGRSEVNDEIDFGCLAFASGCDYLSAYSSSAFKNSLVTLYNAHYGVNVASVQISANGFAPAWPSSSEQVLQVRSNKAFNIMRHAFADGGDYPKMRKRIQAESKLQYQALQRVLTHACNRNVRVQLVILPQHREATNKIIQSGLKPEFDTYKKTITAWSGNAPCKQIEVWDFEIDSPYVRESMGDGKTDWHWFVEPFHFRPAFGAIIADVLSGRRSEKGIARRRDANAGNDR
ncbi:MAG: hypothetical protein ACREPB_07415 [Arenimonas sp.]